MRSQGKAEERLHHLASEGHDAWDQLPTIAAPTLVIHGSDDRLNPTPNAPLLAERISGAELYIVQGAGTATSRSSERRQAASCSASWLASVARALTELAIYRLQA